MEVARDALVRAVTLDPGDARALVLLAETLRRLGDAAGAESAATRAVAVGAPADRADASVVRGLLAMSAGEPQLAAERFRDAQRWMPVRAPAYVFEAQALRSAGDPVAAGSRRCCANWARRPRLSRGSAGRRSLRPRRCSPSTRRETST